MNRQQRVTLNDSLNTMLFKLSDGNPGAITVLAGILKSGAEIDPDAFDPLFAVLAFDTHGIYAERVWLLFKDVCGSRIEVVVAVLRAVQLGILPERELHAAIDRFAPLDVRAVCRKVKAELPRFNFRDFDIAA